SVGCIAKCVVVGEDRIVQLCSEWARPQCAQQRGCRRLQLASWGGYTEIVRLLLDKVQTPMRTAPVCIRNACKPLRIASWQGHIDVVRILLEKGADPNVPD
ncbi:hypothetical protein B0H13DRAFT_2005938, partial [Mycena leptocephala]